MRKSKIAARLRAGEPVRLAMMGHFLPPFIAYAAHEGYDGIWLDLEHRPMDNREVQALMAFFHLYDIDCLLRPATTDKAMLYRYLEDGVTALMMPQVPDAKTAREIVQKVKFPPLGDRGIEGRGLESDYGLSAAGEQLAAHALGETLLAIQIETPQALAEVETIAAIEGVDMLFFGPADMGLRLPYTPATAGMTVEEAMRVVAETARKYGKAWGSMPRTAEQVRQFHALGGQLLVWGTDIVLMRNGLAQTRRDLDEILGAK